MEIAGKNPLISTSSLAQSIQQGRGKLQAGKTEKNGGKPKIALAKILAKKYHEFIKEIVPQRIQKDG
ncbi:MAG: hypothetical protein PHT37_09295 [Candidatus Cloacimonetes bacterium]|nr:hypothetical protein [Candidatus Cloacimonadota bacterium]MDD4278066.1 hypothetical protein [Candidatus Cloacimonadota bacterium]